MAAMANAPNRRRGVGPVCDHRLFLLRGAERDILLARPLCRACSNGGFFHLKLHWLAYLWGRDHLDIAAITLCHREFDPPVVTNLANLTHDQPPRESATLGGGQDTFAFDKIIALRQIRQAAEAIAATIENGRH